MASHHTFHIPVLGIGFSITTPLAVAKYGISSVMSLVDDKLLEDLRRARSRSEGIEFEEIGEHEDDARARRITAWCDLVHRSVASQFETLRASDFGVAGPLSTYFEMLPDTSELKRLYRVMRRTRNVERSLVLQSVLRARMHPGTIDVNIMSKVDKANFYRDGTRKPAEDSDALSALRGFARSELRSSIVFSAGMNPRLYSYAASFPDFLPAGDGSFKKRIIVKVSDFRSARIQGQFLAKKGLWVSEYRIESGLNCGGHAFATDGHLLGAIMEEFRIRRSELFDEVHATYRKALDRLAIEQPQTAPEMVVTVQGGVGTAEEHALLLRRFHVSSVGWGTPFLLVPEATNVDPETRELLRAAGEDDLYLSDISPLGVPFNSLRGNSKDKEKMQRVEDGKPGSPCIRKFLELNTELTDTPICSASVTFLKKKLRNLREALPNQESIRIAYDRAVQKTCLCEGLISSALHAHDISLPKISGAASVCPGPNMAYFSRISTLREMVDHIYGRGNVMTDTDRPHMFVKELRLYLDYWFHKAQESVASAAHTPEFLDQFRNNLLNGIAFYKTFLPNLMDAGSRLRQRVTEELEQAEKRLREYMLLTGDEAITCKIVAQSIPVCS